MIFQIKKERKYADFRHIGISIERYRQRLLSMHHWSLSLRFQLWAFDFRITALWSTYV